MALAASLNNRLAVAALGLTLGACVGEPCDPTLPADPALLPFYETLYALETGRSDGPVRILHLGDSHIAGDRFSGALQARFADRFGDAGRGAFPPGTPFPYYRRQGFEIEASGAWTVFSSLNGPGVGPFGLSGYRAESASPDAVMTMRVAGSVPLAHVRLDLLEQPGGGTLAVEVDGAPAGAFATDGPVPGLMQVMLDGRTATRVTLRPQGDGPVALLGWGGEGTGPGVLYEAQGVPGATLSVMDAWDEEIVSTQLGVLKPDLILLGYGTNEGFDDALDPALYEARLERRIAALRAQAPSASLVVLGAFDGARLPAWVEPEASAEQPAPRSALPCAPLALNEQATYGALSAARDPVLARWHAPPNLARVRAAQAQAAREVGIGYWDGAAAMGGACAIHRFVFTEPPLAYGDHVHLTPAGAETMAERLWTHLMRPYESLVCRRQMASS